VTASLRPCPPPWRPPPGPPGRGLMVITGSGVGGRVGGGSDRAVGPYPLSARGEQAGHQAPSHARVVVARRGEDATRGRSDEVGAGSHGDRGSLRSAELGVPAVRLELHQARRGPACHRARLDPRRPRHRRRRCGAWGGGVLRSGDRCAR